VFATVTSHLLQPFQLHTPLEGSSLLNTNTTQLEQIHGPRHDHSDETTHPRRDLQQPSQHCRRRRHVYTRRSAMPEPSLRLRRRRRGHQLCRWKIRSHRSLLTRRPLHRGTDSALWAEKRDECCDGDDSSPYEYVCWCTYVDFPGQ
jgi:hypothetical protein